MIKPLSDMSLFQLADRCVVPLLEEGQTTTARHGRWAALKMRGTPCGVCSLVVGACLALIIITASAFPVREKRHLFKKDTLQRGEQ